MSNLSSQITLNPDQEFAVKALLDFIQDPSNSNPFFVFSGFAGTGKTSCMREVVSRMSHSHIVCAFTAPTNKAAKVLRSVTGDASTIYSLLGLRIDKSGELKQVVSGKPPEGLADLDVVFVDEGSMVNKNLIQVLEVYADKYGFKVIFLGDPAQLPPVGEPESPIWKLKSDAVLTKVMRHDNQILKLVTSIREVINHPAPCITLKSDHDAAGGVWKMTKTDFKQSIWSAASRGEFADGQISKVISWRNVTTEAYNALIRNAIYGAESQTNPYMPGERLVAASPCERGDDYLLTTDEECVVSSITQCKHPIEPKYNAFELLATSENGKVIRLLVCHPTSQAQWQADCELLAHQAKANGKLWKMFWALKELFHDLKYAYAITAHRSQGSTYENVWVDTGDILSNRTRKEAFQCLYVSCSRPTTKLMLA